MTVRSTRQTWFGRWAVTVRRFVAVACLWLDGAGTGISLRIPIRRRPGRSRTTPDAGISIVTRVGAQYLPGAKLLVVGDMVGALF